VCHLNVCVLLVISISPIFISQVTPKGRECLVLTIREDKKREAKSKKIVPTLSFTYKVLKLKEITEVL
jgi:hypothetical protein